MSLTGPDSGHDMDPQGLLAILGVARRLAETSDLAAVLSNIIDALRDTLHAERASVFQYDRDDHELFATKAHGLPADLRLPADLGIVGEAARTQGIINIPDAYADERFNRDVDKQTGFHTRCLLTIPLVDPDGNLIGVAQVLNKDETQGGVFCEVDERLAGYLADQAAVALKRAALLEAELKKEKLEADLQVARTIQQSALPKSLPNVAGYEIAVRFESADETGGDAYDVLPLCAEGADPDAALIFMGDATGHGVGPALSVVQVLAMIRMACRVDAQLDSMAYHINEQLCRDLPVGRFVTAFLGRLDATRHEMAWVSAGQAPLLFLKADTPRPIEEECFNANGMPFGIDEDFTPDCVSPFRFDPGDVFVLLSDGYYEAMNAQSAMFGAERVIACVRSHQHRPAAEIIEELGRALQAYTGGLPAEDDQTAVLIKRTS
ncbi:MAG: SpoIIE family protein phosphatase [Planctomycetota bacterium]